MKAINIYKNRRVKKGCEIFETLVGKKIFGKSIIVEKILSNGAISPEGFWYDQNHDEFVMVLSGSARIAFCKKKAITLKAGDYLLIPKHARHRV